MFSQYEQSNNPLPPIMPKNWLVEAILVTLCCCLPLGIVAIIQSSNVDTRFRMGDYQGAEMAAAEAKKWVTYGFISGLAVNGVAIISYLILIVFAVSQNGNY